MHRHYTWNTSCGQRNWIKHNRNSGQQHFYAGNFYTFEANRRSSTIWCTPNRRSTIDERTSANRRPRYEQIIWMRWKGEHKMLVKLRLLTISTLFCSLDLVPWFYCRANNQATASDALYVNYVVLIAWTWFYFQCVWTNVDVIIVVHLEGEQGGWIDGISTENKEAKVKYFILLSCVRCWSPTYRTWTLNNRVSLTKTFKSWVENRMDESKAFVGDPPSECPDAVNN